VEWQGSFRADAYSIVSVEKEVSFVNAEASGVFLTEIKNGIIIEEEEEIGCIVCPLRGMLLHRFLSPVHGYLFTIRAYPVVYEGSLIARIHIMKEENIV
jgi:predicted deacylase